MEEEKERLCGDANDQQECRKSHYEHDDRPEMMIVSVSAQTINFS